MILLNMVCMAAGFVWCGWCFKTYARDPHWMDLLAAMLSFLVGIYFFLATIGHLAARMQSVAVTYA